MLSSKLEGTAGEGGAPTAGWTEVRWRVRAPSAGEGQVVCVVGSSEVLGAWNHDAALELAREEGKPDAWWGRARLARGVECRYKYFIREGAAIAKWESWRENRRLVPLGVELFVDDGRFGVEKTSPSSSPSPSSPSPPSSSSSSSDVWEDHGWLVSDIQLRITLGAKSLEHHSKPRTPPVELRDSQLRPHKLVFSSKDPNIVAKSVFLDDDARDELKEHTFHTGGFSSLHLYVDFFVAGSTTKVGRAIITPALLRDLIGTAAIPIVSPELEEVGIFAFEYLIVKPFEHENLSDVLARTYWKSTKFVDVGHRGCGANRAVSKSGKKTVVSENTLLSFVRAGQLGRGAVEFDVQLSKDGVPVIFHDFLVPVDERGHYKVPVYSLTLQKFKELAKCSHSWSKDASGAVPYPARKGGQHSSSKAKQVEPSEEPTLFPSAAEKHKLMRKRNSLGHVYHEGDENRPHTPLQDSFATLEEVFDIVPLSTGFNIEIKYPTIEQLAKGKVALYPERNQIVDAVLKGGSKLCLDHRRNSVPQAIRFAKSGRFSPLLNAPELIKLVKSSGLLLATYGSPNKACDPGQRNPTTHNATCSNEQEYVRLQEEMGVDAVISDHLIVPRHKDASE
ncbi:glycerophosphodiester phosphodiesterase family protein [Acanthamoeba castellanii str. Neff]|uniref:Glycerophosphodiester phosphodiesterase family protein n=1 Tax=Acanthamoeba castellanii (strain ATCC 30010 / Neff) TaxID=1257118 RepID=L8GKN2_ACACF|nr:glycerophosphodiester phosphodiesterase family protein [Acanthamoeba castellanii str. Neff]ELR13293.1 glycerophosphodiester phosphodiesterase family protein [Acanthamoeba castellanii str. Neff]